MTDNTTLKALQTWIDFAKDQLVNASVECREDSTHYWTGYISGLELAHKVLIGEMEGV